MSLCINPRCAQPENPDNCLFCQRCGSELLLAGHYRVNSLLSDKGGFGNTYKVAYLGGSPTQDPPPEMVLKVLTSDHPHAIELFQQEAQILMALDHPGIPKGQEQFTYFPRDSQNPLHCFVMDKVEGQDLEEYQKRRNHHPITQQLALEWLLQLGELLHEVHSKKFFHRDIKPSNIIFQPTGQLALIDFGAVRQITATIMSGQQNTGIYTPGYAPPEQEKGYSVPQSDFYALGRTFVYLLTGKQPIDPEMYDHYNNALDWRKYATTADDNLKDLVDYLMAERANQRPPDTATLIQMIRAVGKRQSYRTVVNAANQPTVASGGASVPSTLESMGEISAAIPETEIRARSPSGIALQKTPGVALEPYEYGGFWLRAIAFGVDFVIVTLGTCFVGFAAALFLLDTTNLASYTYEDDFVGSGVGFTWLGSTFFGPLYLPLAIAMYLTDPYYRYDAEHQASIVFVGLGVVVKWLYYAWQESSSHQGTWGKRILGLQVTTLQHRRLSFWRASARHLCKSLSCFTLGIGFMVAGWNGKKQGIHDLVSSSLIVKKNPRRGKP